MLLQITIVELWGSPKLKNKGENVATFVVPNNVVQHKLLSGKLF